MNKKLLATILLLVASLAFAADKYISSSGDIVLKTAASMKVNLNDTLYTTQTSKVGVGTASPVVKLDVRATSFTPASSDNALLLEDRSANSQSLHFYLNNAGTYNSSRPSGGIGAANGPRLLISGGGTVTGNFTGGVNNFTPSSTVGSVINVGNEGIRFYTASGLTPGTQMDMALNNKMTLTTDGNLVTSGTMRAGYNTAATVKNSSADFWAGTNSPDYALLGINKYITIFVNGGCLFTVWDAGGGPYGYVGAMTQGAVTPIAYDTIIFSTADSGVKLRITRSAGNTLRIANATGYARGVSVAIVGGGSYSVSEQTTFTP